VIKPNNVVAADLITSLFALTDPVIARVLERRAAARATK
jgi:hypothetical protein